ncbi:hypothetical protein DMA15_20440 [Streptomyces sp. WAC 01529]|nr:hypothetical protein DMA15_20440 [Streptomyces sp. WAC 01529]
MITSGPANRSLTYGQRSADKRRSARGDGVSERGELRSGRGRGHGGCGAGAGLRFGLLGAPVLYDATGEPRLVRSAKGRALLAALLLEPDRVVSLDALKDALWGDFPPASARASLQNHVTRLRRLLDDPERLHAEPPGYRLRVAEGELDVCVFEHQVARARAAHAGRDWARVVDHASDALALWRGRPLSGLPEPLTDHFVVPRLEEARLLALEWRYDAELALGTDLAGLTPELAALVAEHPLREAFHRQLMLALHRTGRRAEALATHRELRRRLVEELGVEPGAAVREAHQEVLRGMGEAGAAGRNGGAGTAGASEVGGRPRGVEASEVGGPLACFEESLRIHGEYEDWHGESQARLGLVRALRGLTRPEGAPREYATREYATLLDRAAHPGDAPAAAGLPRHGTDSKAAEGRRVLLPARAD